MLLILYDVRIIIDPKREINAIINLDLSVEVLKHQYHTTLYSTTNIIITFMVADDP